MTDALPVEEIKKELERGEKAESQRTQRTEKRIQHSRSEEVTGVMAKNISREETIAILSKYKLEHQKEYGIEMLGIFGSIARGETTENSDVDVVIRTKNPNLFLLSRIRQELEEQFHLHVDIVSYRKKMNTFLKKRIDNEACYV